MSMFVNTVDVIGDNALTDSIIEKSITEYQDDGITTIGVYTFYKCTALTKVKFPAVTNIGGYSFQFCTALKSVDFTAVTKIENVTFYGCNALTSVIIRNTSMCALGGAGVFTMANNFFIYVPSALVDAYKAATNWSSFAQRFRALEDYTVDETITGELDPTKI